MASSRLRGADAIEWAQRAIALMPGDTGTALLAAPSLANGLAFEGASTRRTRCSTAGSATATRPLRAAATCC